MLGVFFLVAPIFFITFLTGLTIFLTVVKEERFFLIPPVSAFLGLSLYVFLLNLNSKFLPGPLGTMTTTLELLILAVFLYWKYSRSWRINFYNLKFFVLILAIYLITFLGVKMAMSNIIPAADSTMQWSYAANFARGNNPLKVPWQPDLNPNYHLGAYFIEGAINNFTGLKFPTIHTLFNIYLLFFNVLLVVFIFWDYKKRYTNFWLSLAPLVVFLGFGVIITYFPNFTMIGAFDLTKLDQIISHIPAKDPAGAPLISLTFLSYLPARNLALGLSILSLYLLTVRFINQKIKTLLIVMVLSTIALVEESIFLPVFISLGSLLVISWFHFLPNLSSFKPYRLILFWITFLTFLLIMVQGGLISENLFSKKESIYYLSIPFRDNIELLSKLEIFRNINFADPVTPGINWFIPSPLIIIALVLILAYFTRNIYLGSLAIFSAISFALYCSVKYIYCPECSARIYSLGNISLGFSLVLLLYFIFQRFSLKTNLMAMFITVILIIIPSITPDSVQLFKTIKSGLAQNAHQVLFVPDNIDPELKIAKYARANLPVNSQVLVLGSAFPSPADSLNFQYQGLYTTFGPLSIHVNRQEPGVEYFDLALTLNPSLFIRTKTQYLYLDTFSEAYKQLPDFRKNDLKNPLYFKNLISDSSTGTSQAQYLLKVQPNYLNPISGGQEIENTTLEYLSKILPQGSTIYIGDYGESPQMQFWYRLAVVLSLKDKDITRNLSQTEYQVIETKIPRKNFIPGQTFDYYILGAGSTPKVKATMIWSNFYATAWKKD